MNLNDIMEPLKSSHTQSNKDDEGGRDSKDDVEVEDKTLEYGKNYTDDEVDKIRKKQKKINNEKSKAYRQKGTSYYSTQPIGDPKTVDQDNKDNNEDDPYQDILDLIDNYNTDDTTGGSGYGSGYGSGEGDFQLASGGEEENKSPIPFKILVPLSLLLGGYYLYQNK